MDLLKCFLFSELDTLRTETQTAQHESATAASQTAAMMSLNLKLQSSASKNQARHIDLEVKKIEAREARELLTIVQVHFRDLFAGTKRVFIQLRTALPAPNLCRVRHGCYELLLVLPALGCQSRPHQQRRRADA